MLFSFDHWALRQWWGAAGLASLKHSIRPVLVEKSPQCSLGMKIELNCHCPSGFARMAAWLC